MSHIKILQLNFNRCKAAHDLITKQINTEKTHILMGCEQNLREKVDYWDLNHDAFINIYQGLPVVSSTRGKGYVCVELEQCSLISCYFSPNGNDSDYEILLDEIRAHVRRSQRGLIIAGDLNAKTATLMGVERENRRGKIFEDWISSNDLLIVNDGSVPTFYTERGSSVIDFTATSKQTGDNIENWRVETEIENLSDHRTISYRLNTDNRNESTSENLNRGWRTTSKSMENYNRDCRKGILKEQIKKSPETLIQSIKEIADKNFPMRSSMSRGKPVPWWNAEITEKRAKCNRLRRMATRAKTKKKEQEEIEDRLAEY